MLVRRCMRGCRVGFGIVVGEGSGERVAGTGYHFEGETVCGEEVGVSDILVAYKKQTGVAYRSSPANQRIFAHRLDEKETAVIIVSNDTSAISYVEAVWYGGRSIMKTWMRSLATSEVVRLVGHPIPVDQQAVVFACSAILRLVTHSIASESGWFVLRRG